MLNMQQKNQLFMDSPEKQIKCQQAWWKQYSISYI